MRAVYNINKKETGQKKMKKKITIVSAASMLLTVFASFGGVKKGRCCGQLDPERAEKTGQNKYGHIK